MKLLPFKMPQKIEIIERKKDYGKFLAAPLERGWGATVGNSMRRILLSSIQGSAITAVKIDRVLHEFSTIPGILEDMPEIILNLKQVRIKLLTDLQKKLNLRIKRKGVVKAQDIQTDGTCKIINPEQYILSVTDYVKSFNIELSVTSGRGYVPAESLDKEGAPLGTIFIDAFYSPVRRVNFKIEQTRVGKRTDYDQLILEVWTDGGTSPEDAVALSALLFNDHLNAFQALRKEKEIERIKEVDEAEQKLLQTLAIKIADLELSVRSRNCLRVANIKTLGQLVQKTEHQMLQYPNFGRKSLQELIELLKKYKLSFGMNFKKLKKSKSET